MEKKIKQIEKTNDLLSIQPIYLNCVLMSNNEVIFCGKSLCFVSDEQLKKWGFVDKGE